MLSDIAILMIVYIPNLDITSRTRYINSRCCQLVRFKEAVVETSQRGPHRLVISIEELLGTKSNGSCLENREYDCRGPLC
jgi:hypothetical protein